MTIKGSILFLLMINLVSCDNETDYNSKVVAVIQGEAITFKEVDALIQPEIYESLFNTYYARKQKIDEIISHRILIRESKKYNISIDSLKELIVSNSPTSLNIYIEKNDLIHGIPDVGFNGHVIPYDSKEGKEIIKENYYRFCIDEFVGNLRARYAPNVFIKPPLSPLVNLSGITYHKINNITSKNVIWIFSDFECPHCKVFFPTLVRLESRFGGQIEFRYTNLTSHISDMVLLSEFAGQKGKFWPSAKLIFSVGSDKQYFESILSRLKFEEPTKFDFSKLSHLVKVNNDKLLRSNNFQVTPTIVINNRIYFGDLSLIELSKFINENVEDEDD